MEINKPNPIELLNKIIKIFNIISDLNINLNDNYINIIGVVKNKKLSNNLISISYSEYKDKDNFLTFSLFGSMFSYKINSKYANEIKNILQPFVNKHFIKTINYIDKKIK